MRSSKSRLPIIGILFVLIITLFLVDLSGVIDVQAKDAPAGILPQLASTATPTPSIVESASSERLSVTSNYELLAFIDAPRDPLTHPYVVLSAYQTGLDQNTLEIRGLVDATEIYCRDIPCTVEVQEGSIVTFSAYSVGGIKSNEVQVGIIVRPRPDGLYDVALRSTPNFIISWNDSCAQTWDVVPALYPQWAEFVQSPGRLSTEKKQHYLVRQLINTGLVDVSSCPDGGISGTAPTVCGLEKANAQMVDWQNQFDFNIWLTARDYGLPPKVLKTLIEIESQFWPSNQRSYIDEIGLGQVNQLGIDVLLRTNPEVYQRACSAVLSNCGIPYANQPLNYQRMIRGALVSALDATCTNCPSGLNVVTAKESIPLIGAVVRSNCTQVRSLFDSYRVSATYEDYWRYTLVSYHSGMGCLQSALQRVTDDRLSVNWTTVSASLKCAGAKEYVDRFWGSLSTFDEYTIKPANIEAVVPVAQMLPTPTPLPSPTPIVSRARVMVFVVYDENRNGIPEASEWLNNIPVKLTLSNGVELTALTKNGSALFDLAGYPPQRQVVASIPDITRTIEFILPQQGIVPVVFVVDQPLLPQVLP